MKTINRYVRLPKELDAAFASFCQRTKRDEPATIRAIIELFFADGEEVASQRLNAGLWTERPPGAIPEALDRALRDALAANQGKQPGTVRRKA